MKQSAPNIFNPEWFPLYHTKFSTLARGLKTEAVGAYILMLCHQWEYGYVPTNPEILRNITQTKMAVVDTILPLFTVIGPGKMQFLGLEEIREEQQKTYEKRSSAGKKAVAERWKKAEIKE